MPDLADHSDRVSDHAEAVLQLLLFVDRRPGSRDRVRALEKRLAELQKDYPFSLEMIDVVDQPYVAEHFRLVATPALVRIVPEPRQIVAGSNLLEKLDRYWQQWTEAAEEFRNSQALARHNLALAETESANAGGTAATLIPEQPGYSAQLLRLTDEVFRLERDKDELERLLKFKDRAIEMLVHDLRNPLAATLVAVETLQAGMDPTRIQSVHMTDALRARILDRARQQLKLIDRMITNLLDSAQRDRMAVPIRPQKLDLGLLGRSTIDQLRERLVVKQQTLITDIPQDLPPVYADRDAIRQALVNLLDNAIKYTPEGGEIQVAMLHRTTQKVQVSVHDSGPGIPKAQQARIFDEGFRLDRDAAIDGYGLGLAACQQTIRAHYGELWVDSEPGQGCCFHFTLPVYS